MISTYYFKKVTAIAALVLGLSACGGGGGGSTPTPTPTPTPSTATFTCPNGTQQTAATTAAAQAACPAPKLVSLTPADGATGVVPDGFVGVVVVTDSTLDAITLTTANVTLKAGGTNVTGSVAATDGKGFKWTPAAKLNYAQKYDFSAAVKDALGKSLSVAGSFTTATITCTAPQVPDSTGTTCVAAKAKGLSLVAGNTATPGTRDGPRLEASFYGAVAIDSDDQGNVFLADGCGIESAQFAVYRKISSDGTVSTLAGSKKFVVPVSNGAYSFDCIHGLAVDQSGNLYASKTQYGVIQKIAAGGTITTIAGPSAPTLAPASWGAVDGAGNVARFNSNWGITADPQGNLYVSDARNHAIRKIDTNGNVSTFAGVMGSQGSADGTLQNARFQYPGAVKWDRAGNRLLVNDENGMRSIADGQVTTLFSIGGCLPSGNSMTDFAVARDGRIAVTYDNFRCVQIYRNNAIETTLGIRGGFGDIDGAPSDARFIFPSGLTFLPNGDLVISDIGTRNFKRYSVANNLVSLYAGQRWSPDAVDGTGSQARLSNPFCGLRAPSGDYWFSQDENSVRKVDAAGKVTTVATFTSSDGGCVMKVNADGSFVLAARYKNEFRLYNSSGELQRTLASGIELSFPTVSAVNTAGDVYFTNKAWGISRLASDGTVTEYISVNNIGNGNVLGLAFTKTGDLIASVWSGTLTNSGIWAGSLLKITPNGNASMFASGGAVGKWTEGAAGAVSLGLKSYYGSVAVGKNDDIYMVSLVDNVIRRIRNGQVSIVVGTQWVNEYELGAGPGSLYNPRYLAYDEATNSLLILTDTALLRAELPD